MGEGEEFEFGIVLLYGADQAKWDVYFEGETHCTSAPTVPLAVFLLDFHSLMHSPSTLHTLSGAYIFLLMAAASRKG